MPFSVRCKCGKAFNVKDEFLDRQVKCQVCGAEFIAEPVEDARENEARYTAAGYTAPLAEPTFIPPPALPRPGSAPQYALALHCGGVASAEPGTRACPFCAERIPEASMVCPLCNEKLTETVPPEKAAELLAQAVAQLDQYAADPTNFSAGQALRGKLFSIRSLVAAILTALSVGAVVLGACLGGDDGTGFIVLGCIVGAISLICFLVSWGHDYGATHISDARDPAKAFRRYFSAIRTNRRRKAFACLAPSARNVASAKPLKFEKIPDESSPCAIMDWKSFRDYCRTLFKGPGTQVRYVQLKKVTVEKQAADGMAWVTAELKLTSYSSLLYILLPCGVLLCALIIVLVQKRETKTLRKLLIRRGDRWYVAEAEFEGILDQLRLADGAPAAIQSEGHP